MSHQSSSRKLASSLYFTDTLNEFLLFLQGRSSNYKAVEVVKEAFSTVTVSRDSKQTFTDNNSFIVALLIATEKKVFRSHARLLPHIELARRFLFPDTTSPALSNKEMHRLRVFFCSAMYQVDQFYVTSTSD